MNPTSLFEILRRKPGLNASGKFASSQLNTAAAGTETAPRGLALGAHATDAESLDLAQGQSGNYVGHLTRRVVVGGLTLADRVFGVTSATPVGLESPFQDGLEVTVERPEEFEAEGPSYLYSGTGMLTSSTAIGAAISFKNGLIYAAQSGDQVYYTVSAKGLTPMTAGNLRFRFQAV